jgi:hypothetical protein
MSDWHLAATEAKVLSQSMEEHGNVIEQIVEASVAVLKIVSLMGASTKFLQLY